MTLRHYKVYRSLINLQLGKNELRKLLNRYYWAIKHLLPFLVGYICTIVQIMIALINLYNPFAVVFLYAGSSESVISL